MQPLSHFYLDLPGTRYASTAKNLAYVMLVLYLKRFFIFIRLFKTVLVPNEDVLSSWSLSCCILLSFISTFCLRSFMVSFCSSSSDFSCLISHVADEKSSGDIQSSFVLVAVELSQ